jgi:hypothetical protein
MKKERIDDLKDVFQKEVGPNPFIDLIFCLDHLFEHWGGRIEIKTRSEKTGDPLGYFGIFSAEKEKPVLFAGGMEKDPRGLLVPVIRFSKNNRFLQYIPIELTFPYRKNNLAKKEKQNWTNVIISDKSVQMLLSLMISQIDSSL